MMLSNTIYNDLQAELDTKLNEQKDITTKLIEIKQSLNCNNLCAADIKTTKNNISLLESHLKALNKEIGQIYVMRECGDIPKSSNEFIMGYMTKHGYQISYSGNVQSVYTKSSIALNDTKALRGEIISSAITLKEVAGTVFKLYDGDVAKVYDHYLNNIKRTLLKEFQDFAKIAPEDTCDELWEALAGIIFKSYVEEEGQNTYTYGPAFNAAVLKKFIWQVKRRVCGLPTDNDIMPTIVGEQGIGKTYFIRELFLKPFSTFVSETSLKNYSDERNKDLYSYPIIFLDELKQSDRTDVDTLRGIITKRDISNRELGHNTTYNIKNLSTPIATSNHPVDVIIQDTTGMRRYPQLFWNLSKDANGKLDEETLALLNNIDYLSLWKSVDVNSQDPLKYYSTELDAMALRLTSKTLVEDWFYDTERNKVPFSPFTSWDGDSISSAALFHHTFLPWVSWVKRSPIKEATFGKQMAKLIEGGIVRKERKSAGYFYYYEIDNIIQFPKQKERKAA